MDINKLEEEYTKLEEIIWDSESVFEAEMIILKMANINTLLDLLTIKKDG